MKLSQVLLVGAGSFLGGEGRYLISSATVKYWGTFPLGTLIVNVAGGFLFGLLMGINTCRPLSADLRIFLTTGILGGLTTFSTFSYETVSFFQKGDIFMGGLNAALNLFFALIACWLGEMLIRAFC